MTSWKKLRSVQGIVITEIIVLVLMIAVFCAAVWLKFGTWFDNGEVEEAVRLMQTVREAQTQRCAQDNSYLVLPSHFTVLPAEGVADGSTFTLNHFTYDLLDPLYKGMGLVATHHTKNYNWKCPLIWTDVFAVITAKVFAVGTIRVRT